MPGTGRNRCRRSAMQRSRGLSGRATARRSAPILAGSQPAALPDPWTRLRKRLCRSSAWAFDPESGEGAKIHGGRFNRAGIACFYAASNLETAWLEAQQGFAFKAQPSTICSYRAELSDVLDSTNPDVREAADVTLTQLGCAWEQSSGDRKP
ncbi:hypothetical protein OY671_009917, partial [Metschnikowia pulcherrima]